jgi:hypothetical protein
LFGYFVSIERRRNNNKKVKVERRKRAVVCAVVDDSPRRNGAGCWKGKKWLNSRPRDATVSRFLTLLSNNPIGFLPLTLALTLFVFFFFSIAQFSLSASFLFPQVPVDAG